MNFKNTFCFDAMDEKLAERIITKLREVYINTMYDYYTYFLSEGNKHYVIALSSDKKIRDSRDFKNKYVEIEEVNNELNVKEMEPDYVINKSQLMKE